MKAISIVYTLTIATAAISLAGCGPGNKSTDAVVGANGTAAKRITFGSRENATHCRIGHRYSADGNTAPVELVWYIRPALPLEFASGLDMNFEVVQNNFNEGVIPPPRFKIDRKDTFTSQLDKDENIHVTYSNESSQTDQNNFEAILQPEAKGSNLWMEGPATLSGSNTAAGRITVFMMPIARTCKHSYYNGSNNPPPCKRVLIEHFSEEDSNGNGDYPELNKNIFQKNNSNCTKGGNTQETSDGEGHEGHR